MGVTKTSASVTQDDDPHKIYFKLKELPAFSDLNKKVNELKARCSWWELKGADISVFVVNLFVLAPIGFLLLRSSNVLQFASGMVLLSVVHGVFAYKGAHTSSHGFFPRESINRAFEAFCTTFFGGYSSDLGRELHIQMHHPHTNIIGLGDSSAWKVPLAPCLPYMFFLPFIFPVLTPVVAFAQAFEGRRWGIIVKHLVVFIAGVVCNLYLLQVVSGLGLKGALACLFVYRGVLAVPFIHVNIFQHIGLPMYSKEHRPARLYQMSTGVLNLERNIFLDFVMGHSLINCHVEHHLFPKLSDSMCLKIKPLVKDFLVSNNLPYNEDSYANRLSLFLERYDELMVHAPPITHFVGIQ